MSASSAAGASRVSPASKTARPAGQPRPNPPSLALVPATASAAPRAPFVVLVAALLVAGLGGLLFLHTALAEDSFRLHDLQTHSALLANEQQALEQRLALEASPRRLSDRAQQLGMVRSENPAFIRLSDGRILGKPKAGVAPPPPPVASPSPSSSPSASTSAGTDASGNPAKPAKHGNAKPTPTPTPGSDG
jgi:hypothetical protein